ncbi:MAG TPA: Fis family transcriptional regulator [Cyanobacteria bacterium UBA11372]|nr:Fis family transcriptional regulator [Cyanobacteria bacterium UBA11372]
MRLIKMAFIAPLTFLIILSQKVEIRQVNGELSIKHSSLPQVLAQTQSERKAQADRLFQQGLEQAGNNQFQAAIESFQQALKIYREIGDRQSEANTLGSIGLAYDSLKQYQQAIEFYQQALAIARSIGDRRGEAASVGNLGVAYQSLGQHQEAIKLFQQALAMGRAIGDRRGEAASVGNLGMIYQTLGQHQQAIEFSSQSLTIAREIGDRSVEANSLNTLIKAYYSLRQYQQVIEFATQSLALARERGDRQSIAYNLNNLGGAYRDLAQYQRAIQFYQQSLAVAREIGDRLLEVNSLSNLGQNYSFLSQYQQAIEFYQQSLPIARDVGDRKILVNCLNGIANAYDTQGQRREAIKYYEQSLAIAKEIGYSYGQAAALNGIGNSYYQLGEYQQAIEFYQQSLDIKRNIGDVSGEANTLNNLGDAYSSLGQYQQVIELHRQSLAIKRKIGDRFGEVRALGNLGVAYLSLGQYQEAIKHFEQSLALAREIGDREGEASSLDLLGIAYQSRKQYQQAIEIHQQSLIIAREIGNRPGEGYALHSLGSVYSELGKYEQAIELYQQALSIAQDLGDRQSQAELLNNLGLVFFEQGNLALAEKTLLASIEIMESLRENLNDTNKVTIFDIQASPYIALQEVYVANQKPDRALEIAERGRARAFVELLAKRFSASPNAQLNINKLTIGQIQQIALDQNATLVEYSILDTEFKGINKLVLLIWVIKPTGEVAFRSVDLTSLDIPLKNLVPDTRQSIGVRNRGQNQQQLAFLPGDLIKLNTDAPDSEPWEVVAVDTTARMLTIRQSSFPPDVTLKRPIADVAAKVDSRRSNNPRLQKLYQLLIQPISDLLPTNPESRVIFIPQADLFLVPFTALQDAQGKYLIEKHTILTAPAIQVLELTHRRRQQVPGNAKNMLIVGNPTMPKVSLIPGETPQQLAALPNAEREAVAIASIFNTQPLIGNQAVKSAVVAKLPAARIIHLATHGLLNDIQGLQSAIALAPSGTDNGLLTAEEILDLNLNAELVVLSACNTGSGRITGDGVIGLSRALITAGVPSAIVSLWLVPDAPTAALMTEFYQQFQRTGDKAQSLRQAMLTTMQQHPNPRDWAAFTLIGEAE